MTCDRVNGNFAAWVNGNFSKWHTRVRAEAYAQCGTDTHLRDDAVQAGWLRLMLCLDRDGEPQWKTIAFAITQEIDWLVHHQRRGSKFRPAMEPLEVLDEEEQPPPEIAVYVQELLDPMGRDALKHLRMRAGYARCHRAPRANTRRKCACGCGASFYPESLAQVYSSLRCRERAKKARYRAQPGRREAHAEQMRRYRLKERAS